VLSALSAPASALGAPGDLDPTFGSGGKLTTDFGVDLDSASGVAVHGDGKIVVAGFTVNGTSNDFAVARYNADGSLDTGFSGDGKQTTDFGGGDFDRASGVAVQGDGKIVVAGDTENGATADFALARYNADGSLDTSFSGDGKQTTDFGGGDFDSASGVAVQGDGKIVVAGGTAGDFAVARYNADGFARHRLLGRRQADDRLRRRL